MAGFESSALDRSLKLLLKEKARHKRNPNDSEITVLVIIIIVISNFKILAYSAACLFS